MDVVGLGDEVGVFCIVVVVVNLGVTHAAWYQPSLRVPRAGTRLTVHRPLQVFYAAPDMFYGSHAGNHVYFSAGKSIFGSVPPI